MFNVIEKFLSIDGEGLTSGELSTFIRFQGCNLRCSWCDTLYALEKSNTHEVLSAEDIYRYIKSNKTVNVTLTGGEPLIQDGILDLLKLLNNDKTLKVCIETNGAVDIDNFKKYLSDDNISFVLDFKLPSSNMTSKMNINNLLNVSFSDVYKFVIADCNDLSFAYKILKKYNLQNKCKVIFSPVSGKIDMDEIVNFMKSKNLNKVKLQIQLHKIIWGDKKGV